MSNSTFNNPDEKPSLGRLIVAAFKDMADGNMRAGYKNIINAGGNLLKTVVGGVASYAGWSAATNKNLPFYKRLSAGVAVGLTAGLTISLSLVTLFAASSIVPPFALAASLVSLARMSALYISERAELNILRKMNVKEDKLLEQIAQFAKQKDNSEIIKQHLAFFTFGQMEIYRMLYLLRTELINANDLDITKRTAAIEQINSAIEKISRDEPVDIESLIVNIKETIKQDNTVQNAEVAALKEQRISLFNHQLQQLQSTVSSYNEACQAIASKEIILPAKLSENINYYKMQQNKIYSLNLPENKKTELRKFVEGDNLDKNDLRLFYASLANNYLNNTVSQQLIAQDEEFNIKIQPLLANDKTTMTSADPASKELQIIENYYRHPCKLIEALDDLSKGIVASNLSRQELLLTVIDEQKRKFLEFPISESMMVASLLKALEDKLLKDVTDPDKLEQARAEYESIRIGLVSLEEGVLWQNLIQQQADLLVSKQVFAENFSTNKELTKLVNHHLHQRINQYAYSRRHEFAAPHVVFENDKKEEKLKGFFANNRYVQKIGKMARGLQLREIKTAKDNAVEEGFKSASHTNPLSSHSELAEVNNNEESKKLREQFEQQHEGAFELMEKGERRRFLEESVPRRAANIGGAAANTAIHLALVGAMPVLATPAAPSYVAAATALTVVSAVITTAMVANSLELGYRHEARIEKLKSPQEHTQLGVAPDLLHEAQRREKYAKNSLPQASVTPEPSGEKSQKEATPASEKRASSVLFHSNGKKPRRFMSTFSNVLTKISRKPPRGPH